MLAIMSPSVRKVWIEMVKWVQGALQQAVTFRKEGDCVELRRMKS